MKKLRKVILPVAIILIGAGAAFATNYAKSADEELKPGYYIDNSTGQCLNANTQCTTEVGTICTWYDSNTDTKYNLHELEGTSCGDFLYEREMQ